MGLFDDDAAKQELFSILGLEEGKSLTDMLEEVKKAATEAANAAMNGVGRESKKRAQDLESKLTQITETLKAIQESKDPGGSGGGGGDGNPPGTEGLDFSKLPPEVKAIIAKHNAELAEHKKTVEALRKQAEQEASERKRIEEERAARDLRDAVRRSALDKDGLGGWTFDPEALDLMVDHLAAKVRKIDGRDGYEMQVSIDPVLNEPVYKPIVEGLKEFGGSSIGKRFRPIVPGAGGNPPGGEGGSGGQKKLTAADLAGKSPKEIRELADKGQLDLTQ